MPFADVRRPPVSLWEVQAANRALRQAGQKTIQMALLFEAIDRQRAIVSAAQAKTRKMRRQQQVAQRPATTAIDPLAALDAVDAPPEIDWGKDPVPFEGEIWHKPV